MGTSNPDIFAAGDVTEVNFNPTKEHAYMPLVSHAIRQGALAGINIFDKRLGAIGTQATTGMLIFDQTVACAGLTLTAAKAANFDAQVRTNAQVTAFSDTADNRLRVATADSEEIFDMAVICPGVIPQSELLAGQVNRTKQGA
ncbi:hypothetical protein WP50_26260, partial [Lactiplantibacillus plantarum]